MSKTVFDHINAISNDQSIDYYDILSDADKKTFDPYIINLGLSQYIDLIPIVNIANMHYKEIPPNMLYKFYVNLIPKKKRFAKWIKSNVKIKYQDWLIDILCKHWQCSEKTVIENLRVMEKSSTRKEDITSILKLYGIPDAKIKSLKL